MSLTLYYAPTTCALITFITLSELGAEFEVRVVHLSKKENFSPAYLAVNPLHKVPSLVIDKAVLTENTAIQLWLSQQYPQAKLLPEEPFEKIRAVSRMAWFASGIHPHLSRINSPTKFCDYSGSEESIQRLARKMVRENLAVADELLKGREYFFDHLTAVDAYFFWCWRRAGQLGVPLDGLDHAAAHFGRMSERESVKKVLAFEAKTIAEAKANG